MQAFLNITIITVRQKDISEEYLGRVNSVFKTLSLGVRPIGYIIGGVFMSKLGVVYTLQLTGLLCLLISIYSLIKLRNGKNILNKENNGQLL